MTIKLFDFHFLGNRVVTYTKGHTAYRTCMLPRTVGSQSDVSVGGGGGEEGNEATDQATGDDVAVVSLVRTNDMVASA